MISYTASGETRWEVRVEFVQPLSMSEALEAKDAHPEAVPIRGGTDAMVELNFARSRPAVVRDLPPGDDRADPGRRRRHGRAELRPQPARRGPGPLPRGRTGGMGNRGRAPAGRRRGEL